jgi:hypothetical protein
MTSLPYTKQPSARPFVGRELGEMAIDIAGPLKTSTMNRFRYHQTMILADTTKLIGISLLEKRSDAVQAFVDYYTNLERCTGKKLRSLRFDGAGEYRGALQDHCLAHGIQLHPTNAYAHNQNAVVERAYRTIDEMAATLLMDANLPQRYWGYAVQQSVYIKNRLSMRVLGYRSPHELTYGTKPTLK